MTIQAADAFLEYAVRDTLDALELTGEDEAAKQLAIRYARLIDLAVNEGTGRPDTILWHLGPELLRCLESLGATPAARAAIRRAASGGDKTAVTVPETVSWLEQQRQSRATRSTKRA